MSYDYSPGYSFATGKYGSTPSADAFQESPRKQARNNLRHMNIVLQPAEKNTSDRANTHRYIHPEASEFL